MSDAGVTPADRFRENATEIVSTVVTGVWLAALFTGQDWWLAALLFGYVVLVPVVAMLFGDEEERDGEGDWWDGWQDALDPTTWGDDARDEQNERNDRGEASDSPTESAARREDDALATLRARYARGELTDEQFERKLDRLLETETLESVEERARERETERER